MAPTTGTVSVAALKLKTSLDEAAMMTSGFVRTIWRQSSGKRSSCPSPEYRVTTKLTPSM
jgi:hypothetical protein